MCLPTGLYHNLTDPSFPFFLSKGQRLSTSNESYTTQGQNKALFFQVTGQFLQCKADGKMGGTDREDRNIFHSQREDGLNGNVVLHCYRC